MLAIRFNRVGKRNRGYFRVVVQEHEIAPGGRHIEVLGSYDPHKKVSVLKADRIKYWMEKGAQVSDTAWNLFVKEKIIEGKKRPVKIHKKASEPEAQGKKEEAKPDPKKEEAKTESNKIDEKVPPKNVEQAVDKKENSL